MIHKHSLQRPSAAGPQPNMSSEQAADRDAEGVREYSRGRSALFARRPRSATPIKDMHPEGVRQESRKCLLGEDRFGSIIGKFCCTLTGCGGQYWEGDRGRRPPEAGSAPGYTL